MKPVIRHATLGDLISFYGEAPKETVRAIVAELDGEIIGVGSLVYQPKSVTGLKMEIKPEMRRYKFSLHKGAKMLLDMARATGMPAVAAIRDASEPRSSQWLERLGFQHAADDVSGEIWIWRG
jgi:N-acetylglutamate synthase-like GNAT family acetyltransferase